MSRELFGGFDRPPQNPDHSQVRRLIGITAVMGLAASIAAFGLHHDVVAGAADQVAWPTTSYQPELAPVTEETSTTSTESTTTTEPESTTTATEPQSSTTTEPETTTLPPTTTTTETPSPWADVAYDPASCEQPHNTVINLTGADGKPVTAQIGIDYEKGGKIDASGQPLTDPMQAYSKYVYVNLQNEGDTKFCFNAPAGSSSYYEFYPKAVVPDGSNQVVESHDHYGGAMAHRAPANVNITMPVVCSNNSGQTGNIIVDGFSASRLVAWSLAGLNSTPSPGFGVADSAQLHVQSVNKLDSIAANQNYTLQSELFEVKDGKTNHATVVAHNVPVRPCADTHISFNFNGNACLGAAKIDQQSMMLGCEATNKLG